jgi:hypothetical protein
MNLVEGSRVNLGIGFLLQVHELARRAGSQRAQIGMASDFAFQPNPPLTASNTQQK